MKILFLIYSLLLCLFTNAQQLTTPPVGGNKKALVQEKIGLTDVTVSYDRPALKGREGKIWGQLVPYGYKNLGYGTSEASPWRAGANENTTIEFTNNVKIEGKELPAGKYGFFIEVQPDYCMIIFNKRSTSWGSFFYDPNEDALKVKTIQTKYNQIKEWLQFEFSDETSNSAVLSLVWEKWRIPFKIETDLVKDQMEVFRKELTSSKSSDWKNWNQAAKFALENNQNLEEALKWSNESLSMPFVGEKNFTTLSTKSGILEKIGKKAEADSLMNNALNIATKEQLFSYGNLLIKKKQAVQALNVFKLCNDRFPNLYNSNLCLANGYSAIGDFDKALTYANKALSLAPSDAIKITVEEKIKLLKSKTDIN